VYVCVCVCVCVVFHWGIHVCMGHLEQTSKELNVVSWICSLYLALVSSYIIDGRKTYAFLIRIPERLANTSAAVLRTT
jgi:hypothetical protein